LTWQIASVWLGCVIAAAALWTLTPLLALAPAAGLVALGLLLDDGRSQ
jgi:hypothetical protein